MLDIKLIREDAPGVVKALSKRGIDAKDVVTQLASLDEKRRELLGIQEEANKQRNELSTSMKDAGGRPSDEVIAKGTELKDHIKKTTADLNEVEELISSLIRTLPNLPQEDVQPGGESDFEVLYESNVTPRDTKETPLDYLALLGGNIDLERGSKVSGSRFVYLKGQLVRLEFALVSFILDTLARHDFTPVMPPVLVKEPAMAGMGYLDHEGDEIYKTQDDLYLVGTSEQAIGPMHMNEMLDLKVKPLRYVGYSSCFRREAGSYGKDVKGILRLHQFEKVEMFSFCQPKDSKTEHDFLLERQREIMDALELPYRVLRLAGGDTGTPSSKTYDIETWIPSEGKFRETHSTSNTTDFQARRLNIRTKTDTGTEVAHMLNGTAVAMSRILIALIENHQQMDKSILIPKALASYLPFTSIAVK